MRLKVEREYSNPKDEDASLVWVPDINSFDDESKSVVVDEKKFLYLSDIAGLPIGHVPFGLSSAIRELIDKGCYVFAIPKGKPIPSFSPWPQLQEKGGGMVIPCNYVIRCNDITKVDSIAILRHAIEQMPEKEAMKLTG